MLLQLLLAFFLLFLILQLRLQLRNSGISLSTAALHFQGSGFFGRFDVEPEAQFERIVLLDSLSVLRAHELHFLLQTVNRLSRMNSLHFVADLLALAVKQLVYLHVELLLQEAVPALSFQASRLLGALILVDTASHKTSGAVLVN